MFGLDTILVVGVVAIIGATAAGGNGNNNDRRQEPSLTQNTSSFFSSSSSNHSPSVHSSSSYFERRTIWDWWANGLTGEEREILLGWGYNDNGSRYSLKELKDEIKYRERKLLPDECQTCIQVWINESDYSSGEERKENKRIVNPSKKKSPFWKKLRKCGRDKYGKTIKTNTKTGSEKRYYQWDDRHNDIEVYDRNGKHLGSMDPRVGKMYKSAKGYTLKW